ncbi:MAG TPA: TIM barrel protein [Armatimonadota bacterium]|nr:TIM barrel protein [Armatimonadota bacterium]
MARIKQSLSWWCFARGEVKPEKLLEEAAKIGYAAVEMLPQEFWQPAKDHGLRVAIIGGHKSLTDGLNKRSNHDRIEKELRENIALAHANDIPGLICFSGNREGCPDEEGAKITAEGLKRAAADAEQAGVNLCMELLNSRVDHPDYHCDRTEWGVDVCKRVGSPRVKLLYDIYHMQIMEGDLMRTIRNNIDYIGHFHTAGNPGRHDMDHTQEINYPAVMKAITETDYNLFVGHEFVPSGDVFAAIKAAYDTCNVS